MGRYWTTDDEGFLLNDCHTTRLRGEWAAAADDVVGAYRRLLGEDLHSVYLSGSVPRGLATTGASDLDAIAVLHPGADPALSTAEAEARLTARHQVTTHVSMEIWPHHWLDAGSRAEAVAEFWIFPFILNVHAACLEGPDLGREFGPYHLRPEIARDDLMQTSSDIVEARAELLRAEAPAEVVYWCRRIMKNLIRSGFGLVMMDVGAYTRDLDLCVAAFSKFHPDRALEMEHTHALARCPAPHADGVVEWLDAFGSWMTERAEEWLVSHGYD